MKAKTTKTKAAKTIKTKAPKVRIEHDDETTFRVVPLPQACRSWIKTNRSTKLGPNNQAILAFAVQSALPDIVKAFRAVGLGRGDLGATKKFRLPFDPGAIQSLREASDVLQVPATMLLQLCIVQHLKKGAK